MGEINERTNELNEIRNKLLEQEELIRIKDVQKEQLISERDHLYFELKKLDTALKELQFKYDDQSRLLSSVTAHKKNPASNMHTAGDDAG